MRPGERERGRGGPRLLGGVDQVRARHPGKHLVAPRARRGGVVERIEPAGRLDQPGEQRGLGQIELRDVAIEVGAGRGGHAVGALARNTKSR